MKLQQILDVLNRLYPPAAAESWDRVGLICGDPEDDVTRVLIAMDPVRVVADEALERGAQLIITHHPLYLRGTSSVAANDPKGGVVHRLIRGGCALYNAHTNADKSPHGTNSTLARLLGLQDVRALIPDPDTGAHALPGTENADVQGIGRVGTLPEPMTLADFADLVASVLPDTTPGVLAGGPPDAMVRTVALSTGSGDSMLGDARAAGADVYVTADLRHHPASEHLEAGPPWLVNGTHYATEAVMLPETARVLRLEAERLGHELDIHVSTTVTDPWTYRAKRS